MDSTNTIEAPDDQSKVVANRYWFKAYSEDILGDPHLVFLTDTQFRRFFEVLALANDEHTPGAVVADSERVAKVLRITPKRLEKDLQALEAEGLIGLGDGVIVVRERDRHFAGKGLNPSDFPDAVRERKRKSRANNESRDASEDGFSLML